MAEIDPRITATDLKVIAAARQRRQTVIAVPFDDDWLSEFFTDPARSLRRMSERGALIHLDHGRYAIPVLGSSVPQPDIGWHGQLHARLEPYGPYYLGFETALEEHRLTDRSEKTATVGIGFRNSTLERGGVRVAGRAVQIAHVTARRQAVGIEMVRISRSERYRRSDAERTLIDCVERPDLAGGLDAALLAWGRAFGSGTIDPERLMAHALLLGAQAIQRTGALLDILDHNVGAAFRGRAPGSARRANRPAGIDARQPAGDAPRDGFWHVAFNVPRVTVEGWLHYGK